MSGGSKFIGRRTGAKFSRKGTVSKQRQIPRKATVKRHRYVLDWFEVDNVEIELTLNQHFVFEYRFDDSWYLIQYDHDGKEYVRKYWGSSDFRLDCPAESLATLGDKVTSFRAISTNMGFETALVRLLTRAGELNREP